MKFSSDKRAKESSGSFYSYRADVNFQITVPFNFSSTLSNLDITNYLSNPQHCQCNTSKFCYEPHGHVITGDLMVMENVKLRELVAKGPKYREPNKINWQSTETMVSNFIDLYAEQWSKREQVDLK